VDWFRSENLGNFLKEVGVEFVTFSFVRYNIKTIFHIFIVAYATLLDVLYIFEQLEYSLTYLLIIDYTLLALFLNI
jgi:hypothetical protein